MTDPITCMAFAIYFEARGEIDLGQVLVADTIINRVQSHRYPDTVCGVVKQKHQFSFYWDDKPESIDDYKAFEKSLTYAMLALETRQTKIPTVCHYARLDLSPYWAENMQAYLVGNHVFYKGGC